MKRSIWVLGGLVALLAVRGVVVGTFGQDPERAVPGSNQTVASKPTEARPEDSSSVLHLPGANVGLQPAEPPSPERAQDTRLKLRVYSSDQGLLDGAVVRLIPERESQVAKETRTNLGAAVLELRRGGWTVEVSAPSHRLTRTFVELSEPEQNLDLLLEATTFLGGKVFGFDRKPRPDVPIYVNGTKVSVTGPKATFRVEVNLGDLLKADHPRFGVAKLRIGPGHIAARWVGLLLIPEAALENSAETIGGFVEADGQPVSEARIYAEPPRGGRYPTSTDPRGRFVVPSPGAGPFSVRAVAPDGRVRVVSDVAPGTRNLRIQFEMGSTLEGDVVDEQGDPVSFYTLQYGLEGSMPRKVSVVDGLGRFSLSPVDSGKYVVEVETQTASARIRNVEVPKQGVRTVRLQVERPGELVGQVIDAETQEPIPSAQVQLESQPGFGRPPTTKTDENGRFTLQNLPSGRRSVSASAEFHRRRIVGAVDIVAAEVTGPVTIALTPTDEDGGLDLVGIGAVMSSDPRGMKIVKTMPGGGANGAGLGPGVVVTAVDGVSVTELGFDGTIQAIRGEEGTTVQLTVEVDGQIEVFTLIRTQVST